MTLPVEHRKHTKMNLIVRTKIKEGYDPEGTIVELINALHLIAAVHPDFKGDVQVSVENEGYPTAVSIQVESVGINWEVGFAGVYKDWELINFISHEEAKTRIKELTSPKVDQPAPSKTAADAKVNDPVWVMYYGEIRKGVIDMIWESSFTETPHQMINVRDDEGSVFASYYVSDFGSKWGFIEEVQP